MQMRSIALALVLAIVSVHCANESEPPLNEPAQPESQPAQEAPELFSLTVKEEGFDITFTETERGENYSLAKVDYKEGTSVGSSMILMKCVYEIAKARGFEYFVNTYQNDDESMMKIYFTNDESIPLKELVGDDYSAEVQEVYDDVGMTSVSMFDIMFAPDEAFDSIPEGGTDADGLYRNAVGEGDDAIVIKETDRGANYSTLEFGFRNENDAMEHAMFMIKSLCEVVESRGFEFVVTAEITPEGEFPIIWRMHFTNDPEASIETLVTEHGHEYDAELLGELVIESASDYCAMAGQSQN